MEPEVGFEPTTSALQEQRSGQLSYSGKADESTGRSRGKSEDAPLWGTPDAKTDWVDCWPQGSSPTFDPQETP